MGGRKRRGREGKKLAEETRQGKAYALSVDAEEGKGVDACVNVLCW
jgi:hypothetical protein